MKQPPLGLDVGELPRFAYRCFVAAGPGGRSWSEGMLALRPRFAVFRGEDVVMVCREQLWVFAWLILLVVPSSSVLGAPSGLNVIPTADVLDRGVVSLEMEAAGSGDPFGRGWDGFMLFQVGVGHGVEIGFDSTVRGGADNLLNAKCCVLSEEGWAPALAVGIQAVTGRDRPEPYVVATRSVGESRFHGGVIDLQGKARWMAGMDYRLAKAVTFQVDYVSGSGNQATVGLCVDLTEGLSLTAASSWNNADKGDRGYVLNVAYQPSLKW